MSECPHDPRPLLGQPIGMYHCPECGEMVVAGMEHPDYCPCYKGETVNAWWSEMIKRGFAHNTSAEYQAWLDRRAHRNAALEAAAKVADDLCTEEDFHGHSEICLICADIAAAIRTLREEE